MVQGDLLVASESLRLLSHLWENRLIFSLAVLGEVCWEVVPGKEET